MVQGYCQEAVIRQYGAWEERLTEGSGQDTYTGREKVFICRLAVLCRINKFRTSYWAREDSAGKDESGNNETVQKKMSAPFMTDIIRGPAAEKGSCRREPECGNKTFEEPEFCKPEGCSAFRHDMDLLI